MNMTALSRLEAIMRVYSYCVIVVGLLFCGMAGSSTLPPPERTWWMIIVSLLHGTAMWLAANIVDREIRKDEKVMVLDLVSNEKVGVSPKKYPTPFVDIAKKDPEICAAVSCSRESLSYSVYCETHRAATTKEYCPTCDRHHSALSGCPAPLEPVYRGLAGNVLAEAIGPWIGGETGVMGIVQAPMVMGMTGCFAAPTITGPTGPVARPLDLPPLPVNQIPVGKRSYFMPGRYRMPKGIRHIERFPGAMAYSVTTYDGKVHTISLDEIVDKTPTQIADLIQKIADDYLGAPFNAAKALIAPMERKDGDTDGT